MRCSLKRHLEIDWDSEYMKFRNAEVKLRVQDHAGIHERMTELGAVGPTRLMQEDIYYQCTSGRLKLRRSETESELIYYRRMDSAAPRISEYWRSPVGDPEQVHQILLQIHGVLGVVRKLRQLYLLGPIRIHIDEVEHLGAFLELEVALEESGSEEEGCLMAQQLISNLGASNAQLVPVSYVELLAAERPPTYESWEI